MSCLRVSVSSCVYESIIFDTKYPILFKSDELSDYVITRPCDTCCVWSSENVPANTALFWTEQYGFPTNLSVEKLYSYSNRTRKESKTANQLKPVIKKMATDWNNGKYNHAFDHYLLGRCRLLYGSSFSRES